MGSLAPAGPLTLAPPGRPRVKRRGGALDPQTIRRYGRATAAVTELVISVIAGLYAGLWLDQRLSSSPWLLLCLTTLGLAGGIARLSQAMRGFTETDDHLPPQHLDERDPPAGGGGGVQRVDG